MALPTNKKTSEDLKASFGRQDGGSSMMKSAADLVAGFRKKKPVLPKPVQEEAKPPVQRNVPPEADMEPAVGKARLAQDVEDIKNRLFGVENLALEASATARSNSSEIDRNERTIDVIEGALRNTRPANDSITITRDIDGAMVIDSDGASSPYPFEVIPDPAAPTTKVAIRGGLFDVSLNGSATVAQLPITASPIDGDFTGAGSLPTNLATTTTTIGIGETRWVYLVVGKFGGGEEGNIGEGSVLEGHLSAASAPRPTEQVLGSTYQPKSVKVLAKVYNNSGSLEITQEWTGGDIKEQAVVADSTSEFHAPVYSSLGYNDDGLIGWHGFKAYVDGQIGYAQLVGADITLTPEYVGKINLLGAGATTTGSADDLPRDYTHSTTLAGAPSTPIATIRYTSFKLSDVDFGTRYPGSVDVVAPATETTIDWWDTCGEWYDTIAPSHPHPNHTFISDDHTGTGNDRYLRTDGDASRNDMSGVIGDSLSNESISPDARLLANSGSYPVVAWEYQQLMRKRASPSGESDITLDWLTSRLTDGTVLWGASPAGTDTSVAWADRLLVPVGGVGYTLDWANRLLDGADWTVNDETLFKALDGIEATKGTLASQAAKFTDSPRTVFIGDGTYTVLADGGDISLSNGDIHVADAGVFRYYGDAGVTGDGFGGGIKTDEASADAHTVELIEMYT